MFPLNARSHFSRAPSTTETGGARSRRAHAGMEQKKVEKAKRTIQRYHHGQQDNTYEAPDDGNSDMDGAMEGVICLALVCVNRMGVREPHGPA